MENMKSIKELERYCIMNGKAAVCKSGKLKGFERDKYVREKLISIYRGLYNIGALDIHGFARRLREI